MLSRHLVRFTQSSIHGLRSRLLPVCTKLAFISHADLVMSGPPKKKFKQASLLSFMNRERSSKQKEIDSEHSSQDSDIICIGDPTPATSKLMASASTVSPTKNSVEDETSCKEDAGRSGVGTGSPQSHTDEGSSQPSVNSPGVPASPPASSAEHNESADWSDWSRDLFDSDSDAFVLSAEVSHSPQSATVAYENESQLEDEESQTSDIQSNVDRMKLFPATDTLPRRHKPSSATHSLFVMTPTNPGEVPKPCSASYTDVWDNDHVKMPCSSSNIYPDEDNPSKTRDRWSLIESALLSPITSSYDLEEAILQYNSRYKGKWNFSMLHRTINEEMTRTENSQFFKEVLPTMVQLTLSLPSVLPEAVPMLKQQRKYSLTFSQHQLACLLANAFFCTFPRRNATHKHSEYSSYPSINMNWLFSPSGRGAQRDNAMVHKLRCLFNYFKRISQNMPTGCVTFERKVVSGLSPSEWSKSTSTLNHCHFSSDQLIENIHGAVQVDFANCMIGGGVLRTGCVQEEIQFITHPELIISRLFTERLCDNEVLIIKGAEKFSDYTGYADTFEFGGDHTDGIALDDMGRRYRHIIAMDATHFNNKPAQYLPDSIVREMNKAYCGFYTRNKDVVAIATGNWGCGAFKGNQHLKGVLQMMVGAECSRQLYYSAFGDSRLKQDLGSFHQFCVSKGITVGALWKQIAKFDKETDFKEKKSDTKSILTFIRKNLA